MTDARHARRGRTVLPLIVVVLGLVLLVSSLAALVPVLRPSIAAALPGAVVGGFEASGTAPNDFVVDDTPVAVVDDTPAVSRKWLQDSRPKKKKPEPKKPAKIAAPASVEVPSIGVQSKLIKLGLNADRSLQVPQSYTLAGWYTKGAKPGEKGPAVLVGHYDSVDGPGVFYRLTELQPGQTVRVPRADGTVATFNVDRVERFSKGQFPTDRVYGKVAQPELRLITCGGTFNYRTRHYEDNVVVFASLA